MRGAGARGARGQAARRIRRAHHEDGAAAVEAGAVGVLPDVLDMLGVPADEARGEVPARALDGLGVPLERALAPADDPELCLDAHEEPARGDAEDLRRFRAGSERWGGLR